MSQLIQSERYSHGASLRRAGPGDAGGRLGRQWRGGVARQAGRTRDEVSQRPAGAVNTSISRRLGEGTAWAMFVWSWVEWAGADKRPSLGDCHRLPPVCQRPATVCHQLPFPATHCQFFTKIPRPWSLDHRPGTDLKLWRMSRPAFGLWGPNLGALVGCGRPGRSGKTGFTPPGPCHRLPHRWFGRAREEAHSMRGANAMIEETGGRDFGEVGGLRHIDWLRRGRRPALTSRAGGLQNAKVKMQK